MARVRVILSGLLLVSACHRFGAPAGGEAWPTLSASERTEAIALLQDESDKGMFIDEAEINAAARAVRLARRAFPAGNEITVLGSTGVRLRLIGSAAEAFANRMPLGWRADTILTTLGIADVDSVHATLGVKRVIVYVRGTGASRYWFLVPEFPRAVYRNEILSRYEGVSSVTSDLDVFIGGNSELTLTRTRTGYEVGFIHRWGDCPAGCINAHYTVFDVNLRTHRVKKIRDDGTPLSAPASRGILDELIR